MALLGAERAIDFLIRIRDRSGGRSAGLGQPSSFWAVQEVWV